MKQASKMRKIAFLGGDALVRQLRKFREHGVYVLGSFIFGLPSDRPETFKAAQFVTLTQHPGAVHFER